MKFLFIILAASFLNVSAYAQEHEQETPGKPAADEMTLVGKDSGKTLHVEDKKTQEKKHSVSKGKKKHKAKKEGL